MKKTLYLILTLTILLSSCAGSARGLSAFDFSSYVEKSPDYNTKHEIFTPMLTGHQWLMDLTPAMCICGTNDVDSALKAADEGGFFDKTLSLKTLEKYKNNIIAAARLSQKYKLYTDKTLIGMLTNPCEEAAEVNPQLKADIEEKIKEYLNVKYSSAQDGKAEKNLAKAQKYFTKLKADSLEISGFACQIYPQYTFPYAAVQYQLKAVIEGQAFYCNVRENYFLAVNNTESGFDFEVAYVFRFGDKYNYSDFYNAALFCQDTIQNEDLWEIYNLQSKNLKIDEKNMAKILEYLKYSKGVRKGYSMLVENSSVLTDDFCTYDSDYLSKCVFVGDSIFQGFTFYGLDNTENVLSKVGIGSRNILESTLTSDGEEYGLLGFLSIKQPQYIYIMLGLNDINMIEPEEYESNFKNIIKKIQYRLPESKIILCSMTPIRRAGFSTAQWMRKYNDKLKKLAEASEDVYYIDLFEYMSVDGILANKYSAGDGIHFTAKTYKMITDYFYAHQVRPYKENDENLLYKLCQADFTTDVDTITQCIAAKTNKGAATLVYPVSEEETTEEQ